MRGRPAHSAKIAGSIAQTTTEMIMPHSVYDASPGEDIIGVAQPFRQGGAAFALDFRMLQDKTGRKVSQRGQRARFGNFARLVKVPAMEPMHLLRFGQYLRL